MEITIIGDDMIHAIPKIEENWVREREEQIDVKQTRAK